MGAVSSTRSYSGRLGVKYATIDGSNPVHNLGERDFGEHGTEWMYVKATAAIKQHHCVGIDENWKASSVTKAIADDGWEVGFAQSAITKGYHFWACLQGSDIKCRVLKAAAADVKLYTTSTAGVLDDTSTSETIIEGVKLVGAASASVVASGLGYEVLATRPRAGGFS